MSNHSGIDLATLMSISVHDIKNDINHLISKVENIEIHQPALAQQLPTLSSIKTDAVHISNQLVQVLALYKAKEGLLKPLIDQHGLSEFLEEKCAHYAGQCKVQHKSISVVCDDQLCAFFDEALISSILDSTLENALRHAKKQLLLRAEYTAPYQVIRIEDDGPGYPDELLADAIQANSIDQDSRHTGLGFYFAQTILALHHTPKLSAYFTLGRSSQLGGACFSIFLP